MESTLIIIYLFINIAKKLIEFNLKIKNYGK